MLIPITLAAGQSYSLAVSEQSGNVPVVEGVILNPQGQAVQSAGLTATCASPCTVGEVDQYSGSASSGVAVGITQSYMLLIQQVTQTSGANAYGPLGGELTIQLITN